MPEGHRHPPPSVPYVEDYDSDESAARPDTRIEARKHDTPAARVPARPQQPRKRDAASDSGYSSHVSNNTAASSAHSQPVAANQRATRSSQPFASRSSKPIVHPGDGQQTQQRSSRSASVSRPALCTNPLCDDPGCPSARNTQQQYVLPSRPQMQQQQPLQRSTTTHFPVHDPVTAASYAQASTYHYMQHAPGYNYSAAPQPRPRAPSASRPARPLSWAAGYQQGGALPSQGYSTQQHGPPPSPSAYGSSYTSQYPNANWQATAGQLTSGSPRDSYGSYMPPTGGNMLSSSPGAGYQHALPSTYSARQGNAVAPSNEVPSNSLTRQQTSQPPISARRSSLMPGSFPGGDAALSDSESESESSQSGDDEYDDGRRYERVRRREYERERARYELEDRDRRAMPPPALVPARRPFLRTSRTTPVDIRHPSREITRRSHQYSDPDLSSSDYVDSDRTARAVVDKRLSYSSSTSNRPSRQSSVSHGSSQHGRHKSSSLSQTSRPSQQYIVEDAHGRKYTYPTREQAESKALRLQQQQREDEAEAYQARTRGDPQPATLTTENVKRTQAPSQADKKPAASHVSGGSSRKSGASRQDSTIQIQRGDTVFNIPINTTLEVRQTDEGETWVIGSSSPPRERGYHAGSSKSSGSRVSGSRRGSERGRGRRDTIHDHEGGYERRL